MADDQLDTTLPNVQYLHSQNQSLKIENARLKAQLEIKKTKGMRLTKGQIQDVLNQLPPINKCRGYHVNVLVTEMDHVKFGAIKSTQEIAGFRAIEFEKSEDGKSWLLASMCEF